MTAPLIATDPHRELEPFEEEALIALDALMCGYLRGHAPTNLCETPGLGPIWKNVCRHCGQRMSWAERHRWDDANRAEWLGKPAQ